MKDSHRADDRATPDTAHLGQLLYEQWNLGIGRRRYEISWSRLESQTRSTWETYAANPAAIGPANEPWARGVLARADEIELLEPVVVLVRGPTSPTVLHTDRASLDRWVAERRNEVTDA